MATYKYCEYESSLYEFGTDGEHTGVVYEHSDWVKHWDTCEQPEDTWTEEFYNADNNTTIRMTIQKYPMRCVRLTKYRVVGYEEDVITTEIEPSMLVDLDYEGDVSE
jgi:hypothetical protein